MKKQRPKSYQGILRCRPKNSEAVALRSGAHGGLTCPLEKGVSGDWDGSSDAGPKLAGREGPAAMESPQALIAPLERGSGGGIKRNARSVRGWDRVTMKNKTRAVSPLWGNRVALSQPLYRGSM